MKFASDNWKNFLNERILLKPGENGWDLYGKLVADAYAKAPAFDPAAAASFEALAPFIEKMFGQMQSKVNVEFVEEDPYETDEEMKQDVAQNGRLQVFTGGTEHPIFDPELNVKLRAVHDWMAHIQPGGFSGPAFDMKGEIQAYNAHLKTIPPKAAPALFTEVVGQASFFINNGHFPEQKIALLPGFDYFNVGKVDGYDIVGKELDKTQSTLTETMFKNLRKHFTEDEGLYYGTSTIFQEQIALEGIKPPSLWGDFELAENKAQEVANEHGGDPMVVQIPKKQFNEHFFSKNEGLGDYIIYNENIKIGMEEIKREVL